MTPMSSEAEDNARPKPTSCDAADACRYDPRCWNYLNCAPHQPEAQWAATVRPGDTLVLGFDQRLTLEQLDHIRRRWKATVPDVEIAIVSGVTSMVVKPAESAAPRRRPPGSATERCEATLDGMNYAGMLEIDYEESSGLGSWRVEVFSDLGQLQGKKVDITVRTGSLRRRGQALVTDISFDMERKPMWLSVLIGDGPLYAEGGTVNG